MLGEYKDVLTVQQLQDALSIGRTKAYALLRSREIQSFKSGRQIRIPKQAILDYIDKSCYNTDLRGGMSDHGGNSL